MSSFYGNGGYSSGGGGGGGEVISVNGKKGRVTLDAADVHALPEDTQIPSLEGFATEAWVNNQDFLTDENIYLIKVIKEFQPDSTALDYIPVWDENSGSYIQRAGFWDIYYDMNYYSEYNSFLQIGTEIENQVVTNHKIPILEIQLKIEGDSLYYYPSYQQRIGNRLIFLDFINLKFASDPLKKFYGYFAIELPNGSLYDYKDINNYNFNYFVPYTFIYLSITNGVIQKNDITSPSIEEILLAGEIPIIQLQDELGYFYFLKYQAVPGGQIAYPIYFFGKKISNNKLIDIVIAVSRQGVFTYQQFEHNGAVTSVNNQTGNVTITAQSLGALTQHQDISGKADKTEIIPKPATAGTTGQVLTIDANGNPKWDNTSFVKVTDDGQGNVSMETLYGVLIDAAPAQNSNNLVTSGGIYTAINNAVGNIETLLAQI